MNFWGINRQCVILGSIFLSLWILGAPSCGDTDPPYFLDIIFHVTSDTNVVITWRTNEEATGQVEYGQTSAYGNESILDPTLLTNHQIELTNLTPGATYHFRVISADEAGNVGVSLDDDFIAKPAVIDWPTATPESQGLDSEKLEAARIYAQDHLSKGVVIVRGSFLVAEWYWDDWNLSTTQRGYSVAKSFSSALIGICIDEGLIQGPDQKASDFITEWLGTEKEQIKIWHLLTMTSGLDNNNLRFLSAEDQAAVARNLDLVNDPGTTWLYLNAGSMLLTEIVREATGVEAEMFARSRLFEPLGMDNAAWMRDSVGHTLGYQSVITSARGFAKFGQLYLDEGVWEGVQIVSSAWVKETTKTSQSLQPAYGMQWWTNTTGNFWPDVPNDGFAALGAEEKKILVVPSLGIVATRLGDPSDTWSDNDFLKLIIDAIIP